LRVNAIVTTRSNYYKKSDKAGPTAGPYPVLLLR